MSLILETDIGHDPDDSLALSYLIENNIDIKAILVTPGYDMQAKIIRGIFKGCKVKCPLLFKYIDNDEKNYDYSSYHKCINIQGIKDTYDGYSKDFIDFDNHDILIISPAHGIVDSCKKNNINLKNNNIFMQGGFVSHQCTKDYGITNVHFCEEFNDIEKCTCYNVSGMADDFNYFKTLMNDTHVSFITKGITHSFIYSETFKSKFKYLNYLFSNLKVGKKLHDLVAAYCYLNNDNIIVKGEMCITYKKENYVVLYTDIKHNIIVGFDISKFWNTI